MSDREDQKSYTDSPRFAKTVSFNDEPLVLVDEHDEIRGYASKWDCHQGEGQLHRAFSVFVFNRHNELLLQQRSSQKPLWPLYWSNSCCSHPRIGEEEASATRRRLWEELSLELAPTFLYRFRYHARYGEVGAEHELCSVYIARSDAPVTFNDSEVADWRYMAPEALDNELDVNAQDYTPWLKLEWTQLRRQFWQQIEAL